MKWSWRKAFGVKPLPVAAPAPVEPKPRGLQISQDALWQSRTHGTPAVQGDDIYKPYRPLPGMFPMVKDGAGNLAMDNALTPYTNLSQTGSWASQSLFHEGLTFLGYAYLAELALRVEYRHAAEIIGEHATRKWIKVRGPDDKVAAINDELKRLNLRSVFQELATKEGIFGRCQLFLDFDDATNEEESATPLVMDGTKISKARPLKRVNVVEPVWSYPAPYATQNPLSEDFYNPHQWLVMGRRVDATRLLTLVSREVPDILKPAFAFGGQSLTALMKPYVDNWLRTRQSVSDLLHSFSVMVLSSDLEGMLTPGAQTTVAQRVDYFTNYRDNNGLMVVNKASEELTNVAAPIAGLEGLQSQAQEQLASAARIPLSIYIQSTPDGLNASSDGEIRSFYADIHGYQEKGFRPLLETILKVVQLSLFNAIDPAIGFDFEPLYEMSEKEGAEIDKLRADRDQIYETAGVVTNEEIRVRLNKDEGGAYFKSLTGPAPEPIDETEDDASDNSPDGSKTDV